MYFPRECPGTSTKHILKAIQKEVVDGNSSKMYM